VAFLSNLGFDEDAAISMLSVACDFGITQVVDGNWGAHVRRTPASHRQHKRCAGLTSYAAFFVIVDCSFLLTNRACVGPLNPPPHTEQQVTIPKYLLSKQTGPYMQKTMCKTSMPAASYYATSG
jgi:hypothetical protein